MADTPGTWRDPKALGLWVMVALVLWLLIPAGATLGLQVWEWTNPGVTYEYDPLMVPPYLLHGAIGLAAGIAVVVFVCVRLRLGLLWLVAAVLLAGVVWLFQPYFPGTLGIVLTLLVPPVAGALIFKPKSQAR